MSDITYYKLYTCVVYQEKSRQYRAEQRQREQTEVNKKKQEQRMKVLHMCLYVTSRFTAIFQQF